MSSILAKMAVQISANTAEFNKKLAETNKGIAGFTNSVKEVAQAVGVAFAVKEVAAFGLEVSKLAAEAEGVSSAFQKIQGSTVLLNQMRQATEGTVSDLKLMKLAVSAVNNGAPLNELAEILNFIDRTADSTGQNFEELADTVIKNIGKESTKGLNELGLSLEKVKTNADRIGFLPSLMEEIRRKSAELGEVSSKTADAYDRQAASVDNLKASFGEFINSAGVSDFLDKISSVFDLLSGRKLTGTQEQVNKALVAYKQLLDTAKMEGNREEVVKWTLAIARLTSEYGLLKDKALEPVTQSIVHNTVKAKELEDRLDSLTRKKYLAPLDVRPLPSATGQLVDPNFLNINTESVVENLKPLPEQIKPIISEVQTIFSDLENTVVSVSEIIGSSLEGAFSGAFSGVQVLARATAQIVDLFAKQAIAAAIANAAKAGGPFPFAAVALATTAAAAMKGLLSRVGIRSSSGGGGGASFSGSSFSNVTNPHSLFYENGVRQPSIVLEARGASLVAVTAEQGRRDNRIRANSRRLS